MRSLLECLKMLSKKIDNENEREKKAVRKALKGKDKK